MKRKSIKMQTRILCMTAMISLVVKPYKSIQGRRIMGWRGGEGLTKEPVDPCGRISLDRGVHQGGG